MKIGVFDSGVGGLSVLSALNENLSGVNLLYFGDNDNSPYGKISLFSLKERAFNAIKVLKDNGADIIVSGCNTISCTVLESIKKVEKVKIYGIFPPVETSILSGKKTLLLCTQSTAKSYKNYLPYIDIFAVSGLVEDIEQNPFNTKNLDVLKYFLGVKFDYEKIILGCTHYIFAKKSMGEIFQKASFIDGANFTANMVKKEIFNFQLNGKNSILFLGKSSELNRAVFKYEFSSQKMPNFL